jgi:hypothetical protein
MPEDLGFHAESPSTFPQFCCAKIAHHSGRRARSWVACRSPHQHPVFKTPWIHRHQQLIGSKPAFHRQAQAVDLEAKLPF